MKITIEATGTELTPALKRYIESKMGTLVKLVSSLEGAGEIKVAIEISRTTKHHYKGTVFCAAGNIKLGKTLLRAEANAESARAAVDVLKDGLKREIIDFKERFVSKGRRDERSAKKSLRIFKDARFRNK